MDILTVVAFLTASLTKATMKDGGKPMKLLKYRRGAQEIDLVLDGRQVKF